MNGRPILGLLAIGVLALVLSGLGGGGEAAGAGRLPACPETWPDATGWHEGWYVIIDQDSNGNKHGRAYPANAGYDVGYVPAASWETCIVRIKDNPGVEQVAMSKDQETFSGTSGNDSGGTENPVGPGGNNNPMPTPTPTPTPTPPDTYSISPMATVTEGESAALTLTLSRAAPVGGAQFTVSLGYDGDATAAADDVGDVTSPVTVQTGRHFRIITIPTVDDAVDEDDETFTVTVAAQGDGWTKAGEDRDTATVTIADDDVSGITVNAADPVRVDEGATATYTVSLTSRPTADVTISAVSADAGAVAVDPTSHVFTPSQWNTSQTFTVRGVADDDTNDERVAVSHRVTSADTRYAVTLASSVRVAVSDTTSPGQQGSGGGSPPATDPTPSPSGSGNSCPRDYRHQHHTYSAHWHNWSINEANGRCEHYVGHNGVPYHEH